MPNGLAVPEHSLQHPLGCGEPVHPQDSGTTQFSKSVVWSRLCGKPRSTVRAPLRRIGTYIEKYADLRFTPHRLRISVPHHALRPMNRLAQPVIPSSEQM